MFVFVPYKAVCLMQCHVCRWLFVMFCALLHHIPQFLPLCFISRPNKLTANDAFSHGSLAVILCSTTLLHLNQLNQLHNFAAVCCYTIVAPGLFQYGDRFWN